MEGTTELNQAETLESPKESPNNLLSKEAPVITTANQDSPPVLQSSSNADVSSMDRDWPEHFSFFNKTQEVLVEELTLTNYKNAPNIPAGNTSTSSSSSGEKICKNTPNLRQGLWGNFRRIAGGTLGNVSNKPQFNSVDGGNVVYPQLRSFQNSNLNNSGVQIQNSNHFPQIVARNTALKGKEAAQLGGNRDKGQQNIERPNLNLEMNSNFKKGAKSEEKEHCLFGGGSFGNFDLNNNNNSDKFEGVNMREFLKQRVKRGTKMQIFRQIIELLDSSHSQGLSLRHLRPSYFTILPLSLVKYTGGFLPLEISSSAQLEGNSAKKRYLENNQHHHKKQVRFKHQKIGEQGFGNNMSSKFEGDLWENVKSGGEMCKFEERWYASPEEQQNGLSVCPFAANVYSLGILLFELFGYFETWELHAAAMSDLRHRILPPNFLMENPKEAGFCLWLIHPDPSSRPKARDILLSDLITQPDQKPGIEIPQVTFQETESESEVLLHFLTSLKDEKEKQAAKLTKDLNWLDTDISQLERIHSSKSVKNEGITDRSLVYEERLMKSMDHLENAYFSLRSKLELNDNNNTNNNNNTTNNNSNNNNNNIQTRTDLDVLKLRENSTTHEGDSVISPTTSPNRLSDFFGGLCKYAQYNKFVQKGVLRNSEMLSSTNVICSLSFDRDEEYFAAAGVSKKIKIFEFEGLLNPGVDVHYPAVEMASRAKLSCVCWNGYIKNYLASTDYEGVVQLWDASTGQGFTQLTEHRKRAWSVDFSRVDPAMLASGSDDCTVKIWNINEKSSVDTIRNVANVCSVQFSPHSSRLLAFGSADYKTYLYDLRHTRLPWCTLSGHSKAVSFVRFLDEKTVVSASTDNSLKVWDLGKTSGSGLSGAEACRLTLTGHTNEKNFVGLSVHDGYITCGSETNEVYAYYKSFPMPITSHKFGSIDPITGQETNDENSQFVSSVCWRGRGNMVISTNSSGSIKVLQLV